MGQRRPGGTVPIVIRRRDGSVVQKTLRIASNPALTITSADPLTPAQQAFRETWLGSKAK
jgi:hypothetical protein